MTLGTIVASAAGVSAAEVEPELVLVTANQTCDDLLDAGAFTGELKVEPPADGVESEGDFSVTIANFDGKSFDWTSNTPVVAVYVKAGVAGSYLYRYDPTLTADTDLTSPGPGTTNAISHISFCFGTASVEPTPTPEPTPEPTPTPTPTVTPTPTPATEVLGVTITRDPAAAAPDVLPANGREIRTEMLAAALLLWAGAVLLALEARFRAARA